MGRPDEPKRLQASLRGCNAERRCSTGLLSDRTHSESNGLRRESKRGQARKKREPVPFLSGEVQDEELDVGHFFDGVAEALAANPHR